MKVPSFGGTFSALEIKKSEVDQERSMVFQMIDFGSMMKVKGAWDQFSQNHPKFVPFMQAVGREAITDGTIIEIKVTSPAGKEYNTNMKLTQSDLELLALLRGMM